ncbi:MAG: DUF6318 family protein [Actinomycetota bacterium]|nr:DUF6318 family protein [Actinomycetota bacterium]
MFRLFPTREIRIVLAAALTGAVVSCSAEADPQTAPTALSAPTSAPTSTPTTEATDNPKAPIEPVLPAGAEADSRAGAEAFVRYYIELLNYAGATGDTSSFLAAADACESCINLADNFQRTYARGGYYRTKGWRVQALFATAAGRGYTAVAQVAEAPIRWREAADAPLKHLPAGKVSLRLRLIRPHSAWLVREFTRS